MANIRLLGVLSMKNNYYYKKEVYSAKKQYLDRNE